jgi:uncharacterized membrane protein
MFERITPTLTLAAAIGCGLVAGLFFAFSVAVMPGLRARPAAEGMAAMQAINVAILNPLFYAVFMGTAVACAVLAVSAPFIELHGSGWRVAGALLYLIGAFAVTAAVNVPLNDRLAEAAPSSEAGARLWSLHLARWTVWNHARMVAATGAATFLALAA